MKNDYYVLVDYNLNQIIDHVKKLPNNWVNISGLPNYSDQKLEDLTWAGHPTLGWINISSPKLSEFTYSDEWLEINKNNLKKSISDERSTIQNEVLNYKGNNIVANEKNKINLLVKNSISSESFYWKFINSHQLLSTEEVNTLLNLLDNYTQECYNEEARLYSLVDEIANIDDLISIELSPNWPDTLLAE
jgi:hypothetical protein